MEYVRIAILDAYDSAQTYMDNNVPTALHYYSDELVEYLKGTAATYSFTAPAKHTDSVYLVEGNKLSFRYRDKDYYMNIMHVERDEFEVTVEAYSLSFELLNEQRTAYKAASAMSFEEYLAVFDPEHVITLGINEVSEKRITNEWTGEDTILARLFSLATVFSAELEFLPELNDDYSLKKIVMNVYLEHSDTTQGVGQRRTDLTLRYNKEISGITKISDITELYTAIKPIGRDGLTLDKIEKSEYDADENLEYWKPMNNSNIYAVQARDRFPSNLMAAENERYIGVTWEYDTESTDVLYGQALAQLKKNCVPKVSYEVEGYFDTNIGDTVTIADESFNPELYLEARVTEQHRSFTDPTQNKTTFDNFKELQSEIDSSLLARVEELIAQGKTYTAMISTNNGIVFKNGVGETTMTAHVRDAGGVELAQNFEIHWYKDGSEVYIGNPYTISADDVDGKAVYRFEAVDTSGTVKAFYEVTVSDVNDGQDGEDGEPGPEGPAGPIGPAGADGKSLYTWIKYADSPTTGMSDTPEGKQYMGIAYNQESPVESTDYGDYEWSLITGEGVPGPAGEDGKTYYTWIRYADDASGNGMSDNPEGKDYIGIAYNQESRTESNNPKDYVWSLFRGPQGIQGPQGEQGVPGPAGADGKTTYFHIKYSPNANGDPMSEVPDVYIGTYVDFNQIDSTDPEDYTWMRFQGAQGADGAQGIPGTNGEDGKTSYLHIAYANSADGTVDFSITESDGKTYIGQYVDFEINDSENPADYNWTKIKGEDGISLYTWIKYADTPTTGMSDSPDGKQYMGIAYNKTTPEESTRYEDYTWSRITGEGIPGAPGEDGKTLYTWVRYADDAQGTGISDDPTGKNYIGLAYNKETPTESNDPEDYTWSLFRGPQGVQGPQGEQGPVGPEGPQGPTGPQGNPTGITVSDTEPENPYVGMLWKHTGTVPGLVQNATYRWNGSSWELYLFVAQNISVKSLDAFAADLGLITAGEINIPWKNSSMAVSPNISVDGNTRLFKSENGGYPLYMTYTKRDKNNNDQIIATGYARYDYNNVYFSESNSVTGKTITAQITDGTVILGNGDGFATLEYNDIQNIKTGLYDKGWFSGDFSNLIEPGVYMCSFSEIQNAYYVSGWGIAEIINTETDTLQKIFYYNNGSLEIAMRYRSNNVWSDWSLIPVYSDSKWKDISLVSGYAASENRTPQYKVSGNKVELRGQVEKSNGSTVNGTCAILPTAIRPSMNRIFQCADDTYYGCRVAIVRDGTVQIRTAVNSTYVSLDGIFYYL